MSLSASPNPVPPAQTTTGVTGIAPSISGYVRIERSINGGAYSMVAQDFNTDHVSYTSTFSAQGDTHTFQFYYGDSEFSYFLDSTLSVRRGVAQALAASIAPKSTITNAALRRSLRMNVTVTGQAAWTNAPLRATRTLTASIAGQATITQASIRRARPFNASMAGASSMSAPDLRRTRGLVSSAAGVSGVAADILRRRGLATAIAGVSAVSVPRIIASRPLASAQANGSSSWTALFPQRFRRIVASVAGSSTPNAPDVLRRRGLGSAIANASSINNALLGKIWFLSGMVNGQSIPDDIWLGLLQWARPTSDTATGGWATAPLYAKIDESVADDADYIRSSLDPVSDTAEVALTSVLDPVSSSDHILQYRAWRPASVHPVDLVVELRQGATLIASWTHTGLGTTPTTFTRTLTALQADSITDYSLLSLRFVANYAG